MTPSERGRLPDFVVIGAMKGGTSSLHEYLDLRPDVCMSRPKETRFFFDDDRYHRLGLDWYRQRFTSKPGTALAGESSPQYTMRHLVAGVPERMHGVLPRARLIYLVRDPVDRIASAWMHRVASGAVRRELDVELADPLASKMFHTSRYHWQLEAWLDHYPHDQILVVQSERLARERVVVLDEILSFLGLGSGNHAAGVAKRFHESSAKRRPNLLGRAFWRHPGLRRRALRFMPGIVSSQIEQPRWDPSVRASVIDALREDIAALRRLTGQRFDGWSV